MFENDPPPLEDDDLDRYSDNPTSYFDYPPGRQPTEGERLIDGFTILNASEYDD